MKNMKNSSYKKLKNVKMFEEFNEGIDDNYEDNVKEGDTVEILANDRFPDLKGSKGKVIGFDRDDVNVDVNGAEVTLDIHDIKTVS